MQFSDLGIALVILLSLLIVVKLSVIGTFAMATAALSVRAMRKVALLSLYVVAVAMLTAMRYAHSQLHEIVLVALIGGLVLYYVPRWLKRREMRASPRLTHLLLGKPPYDRRAKQWFRYVAMSVFAVYVAAVGVVLAMGIIELSNALGLFH